MKKRKITKSIFIPLILIFVAILTFAACTGKSAYEIAVDNGFVGTEAEWLQSLKGISGRDGTDGESVNIYDLYEIYSIDNPTATLNDFLNQYMTIEYKPIKDAASIAMMSSVSIVCRFQRTLSSWPYGNRTEDYYTAGSGVIYKINQEETYIITNYHVVYSTESNASKISSEISVFLYGAYNSESAIKAQFVGGSADYDIAVLSADSAYFNSSALKEVVTADSNAIAAGESVIVVGNPEAEGISVTSGIISVDSEYIEMEGITNPDNTTTQRVIRVDAAINGGNSGGGAFNNSGQLIGIVNAKMVDESIDNIGYAIPANIAIGIVQNILDTGGKKCTLGITTQGVESRAVFDTQGGRIYIKEEIKVVGVTAGSLAAGKLNVDDVLLSANLNGGSDVELLRSFYLSEMLFTARSGDILNLTIIRAGEQTIVSIAMTDACLKTIT